MTITLTDDNGKVLKTWWAFIPETGFNAVNKVAYRVEDLCTFDSKAEYKNFLVRNEE